MATQPDSHNLFSVNQHLPRQQIDASGCVVGAIRGMHVRDEVRWAASERSSSSCRIFSDETEVLASLAFAFLLLRIPDTAPISVQACDITCPGKVFHTLCAGVDCGLLCEGRRYLNSCKSTWDVAAGSRPQQCLSSFQTAWVQFSASAREGKRQTLIQKGFSHRQSSAKW